MVSIDDLWSLAEKLEELKSDSLETESLWKSQGEDELAFYHDGRADAYEQAARLLRELLKK